MYQSSHYACLFEFLTFEMKEIPLAYNYDSLHTYVFVLIRYNIQQYRRIDWLNAIHSIAFDEPIKRKRRKQHSQFEQKNNYNVTIVSNKIYALSQVKTFIPKNRKRNSWQDRRKITKETVQKLEEGF